MGEVRCFVIGGGGFGIPFYRALQKRGIAFAAGILQPNDIDMAVASVLAQTVLCTEPFMPVSELLVGKARKAIDSVDFVIDCGCPVGDFNKANADLLSYAREKGKKVVRSLKELSEAVT